MTYEQAKLALSTSDLSQELAEKILLSYKDTAATVGTTAAQSAQIGVVDALKAKYVGLGKAVKTFFTSPWGIAITAATVAITAATVAINHWYDTVEETAEKANNLLDIFDELKSTADNNVKTVKKLSGEYEKLSKGVNSLGENVTLTEEEFSRYHEIVNQIAEISPQLVSGYDAEGNAILKLKGNVEALTEAYKQNQAEAYRTLIYGNKDGEGDASDIIDKYYDVLQGTTFSGFLTGSKKVGKGISIEDAIADLRAFTDTMYVPYQEYANADITDPRNMPVAYTDYLRDALDLDDAVQTEKGYYEAIRKAKSLLLEYESEINSELKNMQGVADAYLNLFILTDKDYKDIDDSMRAVLSRIVNTLDHETIQTLGMDSPEKISSYVQTLLDGVADPNSELGTKLKDLLTIQDKDLPLQETISAIESYIVELADFLGEDENELKIRLGLDEPEQLYGNLRSINIQAAEKFVGDINPGNRRFYESEIHKLEDFANQNHINTQDEIAFWNDCLNESRTRQEAMNRYLGVQSSSDASYSLSESQSKAIETYKTFMDKISEVYVNLKEYDITTLMTTFPDYDWSDYIDGVETLDTALQKIAKGGLNDVKTGLGDLADSDPIVENLEQIYDDTLRGRAFGWDENLKHYNILSDVLEKTKKDVKFTISEIQTYINDYGITAEDFIKLDDGTYQLDANAIQELVNQYANAYNESLAKWREYWKNRGKSETWISEFFGIYDEFKEVIDIDSDGGSGDDTSQVFDWYETYLDRIGTKISELGDRANDTYSTWSKRNAELVNQLELLEDKKSVLEDIIKPAYEDKMGDIELKMKSSGMDVEDVEKYTTLIKEGLWDSSDHTLGIETITDETQIELIEKYLEIYEKWLSVSQEANATNREIKDGERQKFENISKQFDNELSILESREASLNNMVALTEAKGYAVSSVVYGELGKVLEGQYLGKMAEQEELRKQLDDSIASGKIAMFSDEWYEAVDAINQTNLECQDLNLAMVECDKQVRQLEWDNFDRMMEAVHDVVEETEFLRSLFSNSDMVDEAGKITKEGLAVLGQHGVGYQTYMAKSKDYANELLDIREQLADDPYNLELQEREEELLGLQRESIQNAMDEKQAMIEIAQEAIQAQIDATQELVDKKKEALDAEMELRDYQNSLTEKTDDLGNLRKQESVYALDNSEEGQQKLQTIRTQIKDAEKDLDEFTYSKWHQDQNTMLDELMTEYTELQEARSADTETLFNDMVAAVNNNAGTIGEVLAATAQEYGVALSDTAQAIWTKYEGDTKYSGVITGATSPLGDKLAEIAGKYEGEDGVLARISGIIAALTGEGGVKGSVTQLWNDYKDQHKTDEETLSGYNTALGEKWTATDGVLGDIKTNVSSTTSAITSMQEALLGDEESGLGGINSALAQIFEWLEDGNFTGATGAGSTGGSDSSKNAGSSSDKNVASGDSLIGEIITSASGKWYESSSGKKAGTTVDKYSPDYWMVDKYKEGAAYPYHIQAFIDGQPSGGSGWVKASQIGYKHGSQHIDKDQYAWTQEGYGENELVYRASDGAIYTRLGEGDMVFTHEQTQKLWELTRGNLGVDYPMKQYRMPDIPTVVNGGNVYLNNNITLPNVREPEDFAVQLVDTLKHSSKAQKAIRAVSVDLLAGKSIMGVNRI